MELIDTHTHPFDEAFDVDRAEVVARACEAGVRRMMCPAIDAATHAALFGLCDAYPDVCLPMMGLHPTSVNDNPDWRREVALVEEYLSGGVSRRFYAVGEVGLDFYWSREWQREQEEAFRRQVEFSLRFGLPLVIHTREAWPEMLGLLREFRGSGVRGVMHAFSGTWEEYEAVKACGDFLFGIGGVVTYKKSTLPEVVSRMPLGDMVLETDAPLSAAGSLPGEAQRAGLHRPRLQESGRTEGHRSGGGGCGDIRQCVPDVRHLILPSPVFNEFVTSAASRITKKSLNCTPFPAHGGPCGVFYSIFVEVVEEIIGLWEGRQCF